MKRHFWKLPTALAVGSFVVFALACGLALSSRSFGVEGGAIPGIPDTELNAAILENRSGAGSDPAQAGDTPRLFIEKLGVNIPIVEGKTEKVLLKGAWSNPYGSTPDKGGNTVLFGHRWLHKPPHPETFYDLDKLKIGDTFSVDWQGKRYNYMVTEILVVNPKDVWVLKQTQEPTATLITCTPMYTTKQRLIIRATQIET